MKIFDQTKGKYDKVYNPTNEPYYAEQIEHMLHYCYNFQTHFAQSCIDVSKLLNNTPVFLVDSLMSEEWLAVPEYQSAICVPADRDTLLMENENFNINDWANSKEGEKDDPLRRTSKSISIRDLLGVYISEEHDVNPRRIFIWMDKIVDAAKNNSSNNGDQIKNARVLFELVLYHEMVHALMDVELYGVHPSPFFSYDKDYPYRFFEEAYANAIALKTIMDDRLLSSQSKAFVEHFVKSQGNGYTAGWELHKHVDNIDQWMGLKVLFNYEFALLLKDWWKDKRIDELKCFEGVARCGWIAVKDHFGKWDIMELPSQIKVLGFKKYDSFWSFDDNGLCMVKLDQDSGYLYGYVNEQGVEQIPVEYDHLYSFENGITIAKKDGWYGAIDINNQIVIPFNLPYEDVRGFRNGRAAVKAYSDKWGVIDTKGKLIVPCSSDEIIL